MDNNFHDVEQRVQRYWYTDGIGELIGGGAFILLGIYFALQEFLNPNSLAGTIWGASFVLLFIGGTQISQQLVNMLKTRLTYPRTGYVEYQANAYPLKGRWVLAAVLVLAFVTSVLTIAFARACQILDVIVALTGLIIALVFVMLCIRSSGLARFYILGSVSLVLGLVLSLSGLRSGYNMGLFYGLMGVCTCISGGLTLWRYLKRNPMSMEN